MIRRKPTIDAAAMRMGRLGAVALSCLLFCVPALAQDAAPTGDVVLRLSNALWKTTSEGAVLPRDLGLELQVQSGQWDKEVWGYACFWDGDYGERLSYNKADHEGRLDRIQAAGNSITMTVDVAVSKDVWPDSPPGGPASYRIEIRREGDKLAGSYSGTCNGKSVAGKVTGSIQPFWPAPIGGYVPVQSGEHPRLVFRKSQLPALRAKAASPEGQAVLAALRTALQGKMDPENAGSFAAGHALLHVLNDDEKDADKARNIVAMIMNSRVPGGEDAWRTSDKRVLRAPPVLGVALAYDLCHDAWDPMFREKVSKQLLAKARDLIVGGKAPYNDNPSSYHYGVCNGVGGVAALAVLHEKGEYYPRPADPGAPRRLDAPADYQPQPFPAAAPAAPAPPGGSRGPVAPVPTPPLAGLTPVARFENDQTPAQWLYAGPFRPEGPEADHLEALGGRAKARPKAGDRVAYENQTAVFMPLPGRSASFSRYPDRRDAPDAADPGDRTYTGVVYYYTVVQNDKPRLAFVRLGHDASRLWVSGQEVREGEAVELGAGFLPILLQSALGKRDAAGVLPASPRFEQTTQEAVAAARREYLERLARWQEGYEQYVARGGTLPEPYRLAKLAELHVKRHLAMALGDRGWPAEGENLLRYARGQGVLPFIHAQRYVLGRDFLSGGAAAQGPDWATALLLAKLLVSDGKLSLPHYSPGSDAWERDFTRCGDWAMSLGLLSDKHRGAALWLFNPLYGLDGDRSFDVTLPHHAIYAVAGYPYNVRAQDPAQVLPRAMADRARGGFVFRNQWKDGSDFIATIYAKERPVPGWSFADAGSFRIWGLGAKWAIRAKSDDRSGEREHENVVLFPAYPGFTGVNGWLGAKATYYKGEDDGSGVVSMNMDAVYLGVQAPASGRDAGDAGRRGAAGRGIAGLRLPNPEDAADDDATYPRPTTQPATASAAGGLIAERFRDLGIKGLRSFAVDYSGQCGAPALFAVVDQITPLKPPPTPATPATPTPAPTPPGRGRPRPAPTPSPPPQPQRHWVMHTGEGRPTVAGNSFTIQSAGGATMKGTVVTPANAKLAAYGGTVQVSAPASAEGFFIVMTVHQGDPSQAPHVLIAGPGLDCTATIGKRKVAFDGQKIVVTSVP